MGQNSSEVSYGFGQMGSSYHNNNKPIYPPKGMVIIAIQFLSSNKLATLETELMGPGGSQFITTETSEAVENNYLGVTEAAMTGSNTSTVFKTNDTVEISAANDKITVGQYVLLVNDGDELITGLTVDSETKTPIYKGPAKQGTIVKKVNGVNITTDPIVTASASKTMIFLDEHHGAGATDIVNAIFPTGMCIYGRWTKAALASDDPAGGAIFYFGI